MKTETPRNHYISGGLQPDDLCVALNTLNAEVIKLRWAVRVLAAVDSKLANLACEAHRSANEIEETLGECGI